jgi:hypothetical protein
MTKEWDSLKLVMDKKKKQSDYIYFSNTISILKTVKLDDDNILHRSFRDSIKRFVKVLRIDNGIKKTNQERLRILISHMVRKQLLTKEQIIRIVLF